MTGSSIASASVFTKVSVPQMMAQHYNPRFAVGVVAGSSVLGMIIPPSVLLIVWGIIAEKSIAQQLGATRHDSSWLRSLRRATSSSVPSGPLRCGNSAGMCEAFSTKSSP